MYSFEHGPECQVREPGCQRQLGEALRSRFDVCLGNRGDTQRPGTLELQMEFGGFGIRNCDMGGMTGSALRRMLSVLLTEQESKRLEARRFVNLVNGRESKGGTLMKDDT
ncbi:MAG: hypothetical protein ACYS76_06730 [Planctomycetota bacterium]|jgi:hypothetical protein